MDYWIENCINQQYRENLCFRTMKSRFLTRQSSHGKLVKGEKARKKMKGWQSLDKLQLTTKIVHENSGFKCWFEQFLIKFYLTLTYKAH